ncbi:hypothetical protein T440DRAFT_441440 [Plenodomus tracheiphilus IPT5]|uniref:ABM domain-containing protein n=1 Tax=Plenodomus tracheiphilus IPT5 TaxID=1408161 RepID=A0A6A7BIL4_9PLEO|nr:hypothetical protein T440DRAFT_441440 [Plenodomus tracheiphilus IPT5]
MSERTIEVASLDFRPDIDLTNGNDEGRKSWDSALQIVAEYPGVLSVQWGSQIEHPNTVRLIVEWDVIDSHLAFASGPTFGPFMTILKPLLKSQPSLINILVPASSHSDTDPLSQPVIGILKLYFLPSATSSSAGYDTQFSRFQAAAAELPQPAPKGVIGGWLIVPAVAGHSDEVVEGTLFAGLIGWPSLEAYEASEKTGEFQKAALGLKVGVDRTESVHVALNRVK